ncbi:hypothetical protein F4821DRAFT_228774 [Hypoxylon rubiginosum]|uniref:Uncharacterized protein n=1 Tax=Hypoxylon rubiginosum TaxID=110542 RepID=A0ACC0DE69_9PEZI|nr:hypothetical protein F4821DRAFT_228774 [Hypoxylon rubiginosum]
MSFPLTEEGLFDPVLTAACPEGTDPWNSGELDLDNLFDFNNLPFVGASDILTDVDGAWLSHAGTNVDTNVVTLQQPTTTTTMTMLQTTTPQPIAALQTATPISQHICSSQPTSDEDNDEEQLVQGVARQLKAFVDGLQISGKLDDIERLRFQLLEKDLIIAELREKLQRSERKLAARPIPVTKTVPVPLPPPACTPVEPQQPPRRPQSTQRKQQLANTQRVTKGRSAFSGASRQETALTRKMGACLYCRRRKERCKTSIADPDGDCLNCAAANSSVHRFPCIRTRIPQVRLYHICTTEKDTWTVRSEIYRPTDLSTAVYSRSTTVDLTQDIGHSLTLAVSEFIPIEGDETSYIWTIDGATIKLEMPCYAITNMQRSKVALQNYMETNLNHYIEYFIGSSARIVYDTFQIALAKAQKSVLLHNTLRLWIASRLVEKPWRICGTETLGMAVEDSEKTPYAGKIPISPVMDSQFDQIVIQCILNPLRTQVLKGLEAKVNRTKREDWFETYLLVFLLLNNIELSTAHDHKFANLHHHVTPGRGTRFEDYSLIEAYFHSAQVLIAHFREAMNGHQPFHPDYTREEVSSLAGLGEDELAYLDIVRDETRKMKTSLLFLRTRHKYESMLYWCHQLFYGTWDSSQVFIRELGADEEVEGPYY